MPRPDSSLIALVLSLCVPAASAAAQVPPDPDSPQPIVVAVIDFTNASLVDHAAFGPAQAGVAALLIGELHGQPGIQLVERERLDEVLDELDLARSGRIGAAGAARAGRLLGARYVITGVILIDPGGTLRIDARAVEVETAAVAHTETVVGEADDLIDAVTRLGARLDLGLALHAGTPRPTPSDTMESVARRRRADLSYARALQREDRRDPVGALIMYRAFLEACPDDYAPELQARARTRIAQLSAHPDDSAG